MKLSPEFKIVVYIIFIAATFLTRDVMPLLVSTAAAAGFFFFYPDKAMRQGLIPISIFLLITFLSGLLFTGGKVIASFAGIDVTLEGLNDAAIKTARVFLMITGAKLLMLTTSVEDMIEGLSRMLPSSRNKPYIRDFIEIAGMALRALPAIAIRLKSDFREKAAAERPLGLIGKVRLCASLVIPLLGEIINSPERVFGQLIENGNKKERHA
ncbi:MAG: energy-coupling factor transporter transmembrane protein EcfT [Candidatus Magnetominusculus sp. LBB02]|nr:energy-coupling factor transporter transmembrane protein EcfT [Candidatus Magnetominusculus sp. LBB02]